MVNMVVIQVVFILKSNNKCIYIAGDTALTYDMKLIPIEFDLDLSFTYWRQFYGNRRCYNSY